MGFVALSGKTLPKLGYLGAQGVAIACVLEDIIGARGFFSIGNLVREANSRVRAAAWREGSSWPTRAA